MNTVNNTKLGNVLTNLDKLSAPKNDKEALEMFADHLIKEKNSPLVNDKNRQEIKNALLVDLNDAITRKFVSVLLDEDVKKLNEMLDKKASDDKIAAFFDQKIPDQKGVLTEILIEFRKGYLSVKYPPREEEEDIDLAPAPVKTRASHVQEAATKPLTAPVAPPMPFSTPASLRSNMDVLRKMN